MTAEDTALLIRYMLTMYPNARMDAQKFKETVQNWTDEFRKDSKEAVGQAAREAMAMSPDWMPTVPQIKNALWDISSRIRTKTPEEEFRDAHGGKSKEEWEALEAWERSDEGITKLRMYKKKLQEIFGR